MNLYVFLEYLLHHYLLVWIVNLVSGILSLFLDYVTESFGPEGARYTDIIKFAYYLGAHNAYKFNPTDNRGYYAMAFSTRYGGHLIQGGKNYLVKGINNEGKERYFALSEVDNFKKLKE